MLTCWFYRNSYGREVAYDYQRYENPLLWLEAMQDDRTKKCELKHKGQQTFHSVAGKPETYGDMLSLVLKEMQADGR